MNTYNNGYNNDSPCVRCTQNNKCEKSADDCARFRSWFKNSWRDVTAVLRTQTRDQFVFRMIPKNK